MMQYNRLGLIGGGYWGKNLIREFYNIGALHTICEINPNLVQEYKDQYPDIQLTSNWSDLLNSPEISSICISLPAEMHYRFAKEALLADKDVYVEKPITLSVVEAEEIIAIAEARKRILMVGHLLHYHPCIDVIKQTIAEGRMGRVKNIVSNRLNLGKFRTSENVLWSFAPHDISIILSLCNNRMPSSVVCVGKDLLTRGIADVTNTILKWDELDVYANINVNWLNPYKEQKLVIIGEKGMIIFDDVKPTDKLEFYENYLSWSENIPPIPEPIKKAPEYLDYNRTESPLARECAHFIDCCKSKKTPMTDGKEGLRVLQVLQQAQEDLKRSLQPSQPIRKDGLIEHPDGYFYHSTAIIDPGANIGRGTKIWHYSHICSGCQIGAECNIGQNVFVAGGSTLGKGCKVQNNVSIYAGVHCEDYVFLGPSCVLTNDINPRAQYSKGGHYVSTYIETGVTIGANATIVCGHRIGHHALIGAGAVVTRDVPANRVMVGNPAKEIRQIDEKGVLSPLK